MIGYLTRNHPLIQAFAPRPARRTRRESLATHRLITEAPQLADFLREEEIIAAKGPLDRAISGLALDSRRVLPGNVFFALPGRRTDGLQFADEAIRRGAVAVVAPKLPALPSARVTWVQVADARATLAAMAQRFFRFPDREMSVIGVTGSSGKTSVAHVLKHLLNGDQRVGLLGSIHYDLGQRTVPANLTTPESLDVYGLMAQMRDAGCRQVVVEVSSHGLVQQRVQGMQWGAAVFTNLTREHLDFHGSMENYLAVKRRLFTGETGGVPPIAVINVDDAAGSTLAASLTADGVATRLVTYGEAATAQVRAEQVEYHACGVRFELRWPGGRLHVESPLIGRGHLSNLLAALATAWGLGRDPLVLLARLRTLASVPGRMERLAAGQDFDVVVDAAASARAIRQALTALRPTTPGRLIVVFGCDGNRDRAERAGLTRTVQELADFAIATSDNPRTEGLARIFSDMSAGVTAPERIQWDGDRRRAIEGAFAQARPGDCVLLAGRGHEAYQELADTVVPFDDRQVAREMLGRIAAPVEV